MGSGDAGPLFDGEGGWEGDGFVEADDTASAGGGLLASVTVPPIVSVEIDGDVIEEAARENWELLLTCTGLVVREEFWALAWRNPAELRPAILRAATWPSDSASLWAASSAGVEEVCSDATRSEGDETLLSSLE